MTAAETFCLKKHDENVCIVFILKFMIACRNALILVIELMCLLVGKFKVLLSLKTECLLKVLIDGPAQKP